VDAFLFIGRAVAHPTRLEILRRLGPSGLSVEEIASLAGVAKSTASYHVGVLQAAGLVKRRRKGHKVIYSWGEARWVLRDERGL
jgi:DNA-binding transcriptional ArsR family regulator